METKIEEDAKRYHALFDQAPLGVLIIDPQTARPVEFNELAHQQLGYTREEFAKLGIYDYKACENQNETKANIEKVLQEGKVEFETKHRTKTGEIRDVIVTSQTIELSGKTFLHSTYRDVTKAKEMEIALMQSETMYRLLVELAQEGIWALDKDNVTVYVNPLIAKMLGYKEYEIIGKKIGTFMDTSNGDIAEHNLVECKPNSQEPCEFKFVRKDGDIIYVNAAISPIQNDNGTYQGTLVLISEITDRKKMEQQLKEKMGMLESVTDNVGAGLIIIDKNYSILWMNNYLKQLGFSVDKPCYSTFAGLDSVCPLCGVKKVFEGASIDSREYYNARLAKQDKPPWFELIATPVKDKNGEVTAALELTINITEKKHMQQKLTEYSQQMEKLVEKKSSQLEQTQQQLVKSERLAAIGQVAAMVGHDLRNPLTGINGATYYVKKKIGPNADPKIMQMLDLIERDIQYANKIITDLMDYSREIKLELTETVPNAIVAESVSLVQIPENIEIGNAVQNTPKIKIDVDKMKRVFANFIKNAIEAMPQGGKLAISSQTLDGEVKFKFVDTGAGMTKEVLDKIWTPFFTTKAKGMGLGLAICRRIIDAHVGKVSVESIVGEGTTFTVNLPIETKSGSEKT